MMILLHYTNLNNTGITTYGHKAYNNASRCYEPLHDSTHCRTCPYCPYAESSTVAFSQRQMEEELIY